MKLPALLPALLALATSAIAADIVTLPDTQPLTWTGDLSAKMHEAALHDMDERIAHSLTERAKLWHRDISSPQAYAQSVAGNRGRFLQAIGLAEPAGRGELERFGDEQSPALVAETSHYRVWQVRWRALEGVHGEGLLLEPRNKPRAYVIAIPDADQTPEQIAGLAPGVPAESQFARRLVENGFAVIVPVLVDRSDAGSGNSAIAMTNQPHREWIYRQAYMMGRHIIGYEVQKVLAASDWASSKGLPVGIVAYGEGGLIGFYAAVAGQEIKATMVSGYFKSRQQTSEEPLYRNVKGLLREFGDAEIASLIAPRGLVVEYSAEPSVDGPPAVRDGRKNCAAPGKLTTPTLEEVNAEFQRIDSLTPPSLQTRKLVTGGDGKPLPAGSQGALAEFAKMLGTPAPMKLSAELPKDLRHSFDPLARQWRQVKELEAHVQNLVRISNHARDDFFLYKVLPEYRAEPWTLEKRFEPRAPEPFIEVAKQYRKAFWEEIIGKIEDPLPAPNPRTRKIYDEPKWTGYEVVVDTGGDTFGWGILCVPKDLKPGERRPVVVCQHGRHGLPENTITGDKPAYRNFAARLAEQGFITFAPHNLYQKEAYYRTLSRKGNTVGLSMFSEIIHQHEQWLAWLGSLPFVDAKRIGFYGLSYGGESAVRIPPLLDGYCLSICSGDFNDWPRKVASTDDRHSFMFTDEWEMPYFNMGNTFSYAELTYLMFPRPFMAERGHHDGVAPDDWVASEYAKTRWFYDQFGLGDRTAIEFFNGGHTINGQGTFEFLHKHLNWPAGK
jgi:dienelactone hydrolase